MELEEIFASPFTTPTTCYTSSGGGTRSDTKDAATTPTTSATATIRFATQSHLLGVTWRRAEAPRGNHRLRRTDEVRQSSVAIAKDSARLICVGYSERRAEGGEDGPPLGTSPAGQVAGHLRSSGRDGDTVGPPVPSGSVLEAIAMIDPRMVEDDGHFPLRDETSAVNLYHPSQHQPYLGHNNDHGGGGGRTDGPADDAASVVSTADMSVATSSVAHSVRTVHTRNTSVASAVVVGAATAGAAALPGAASGGAGRTPPPHHQRATSELSVGSILSFSESNNPNLAGTANIVIDGTNNDHPGGTDAARATHSGRRAKARLILQWREDGGDPGASGGSFRSSAVLDYRPVCPRVSVGWGGQQQQQQLLQGMDGDRAPPSGPPPTSAAAARMDVTVGVWVGSADDAVLRFYVPSGTDPRWLQPIVLPEEHFSFDAPVLGLDFHSVRWTDAVGTDGGGGGPAGDGRDVVMHTLAAVCQDGAIQLVSWTGKGLAFDNLSSTKVIVDGPLVCIRLNFYSETSLLRAVVGSLCGYVCQLTYDRGASAWCGPFMIAEGLHNPGIDAEDSVLAVDVWENYVAVGTQAGRCLLYATRDSENYFKAWEALLPYSIHGIQMVRDSTGGFDQDADDDRGTMSGEPLLAMRLAVTTRRSFHLFQVVKGQVPWRIKPSGKRYDPDLARERLLRILYEVREENAAADARVKALVQETIDGMVETVEETAPVRQERDGISASDASNDVPDSIGDPQELVAHAEPDGTILVHHDGIAYAAMDEPEAVATPRAPQLEYSSSDEEDDATTEVHSATYDVSVQGETTAVPDGTIHSASIGNTASQLDDADEEYVLVETELKDFGTESD